MRRVLVVLILLAMIPAVFASSVPPTNAPWPEAGLRWIKSYRDKHDPGAVPQLIHALSSHGAIRDPDTAGIYVGFFAGVLGANPTRAWALIERSLPLPFEDQWIVIRALAYSGLPNWKDSMRAVALHLPDRRIMAEHYVNGELPSLQEVALDTHRATTMDRVKGFFRGDMFWGKAEPAKRKLTFASSPELIDTLWGMYYATGDSAPIARIVILLPWSKDRDNAEKLTIGSMAKFTLASNAARDVKLLSMLRALNANQRKEVKPILAEVIEAAETSDTGHLGKEALAALDELKRKGPASTREMAWWGGAGEAALSFGCLGLAAVGQVAAGVPCVLGGALTTGALRYLGRTE